MTNTGQTPTIEERLSRLETFFANVGEKVAQHDGTIDVLVSNIQQLTERVDTLTVNVDRVTTRVDTLAAEAAQDRQQAAIERQEFNRRMDQQQSSIQQILEYLRDRNGGSSPPN